jgi:hypothetical protein
MEHSAACASQLPGDRLIELICAEPVRALDAQERETICARNSHICDPRGGAGTETGTERLLIGPRLLPIHCRNASEPFREPLRHNAL